MGDIGPNMHTCVYKNIHWPVVQSALAHGEVILIKIGWTKSWIFCRPPLCSSSYFLWNAYRHKCCFASRFFAIKAWLPMLCGTALFSSKYSQSQYLSILFAFVWTRDANRFMSERPLLLQNIWFLVIPCKWIMSYPISTFNPCINRILLSEFVSKKYRLFK